MSTDINIKKHIRYFLALRIIFYLFYFTKRSPPRLLVTGSVLKYKQSVNNLLGQWAKCLSGGCEKVPTNFKATTATKSVKQKHVCLSKLWINTQTLSGQKWQWLKCAIKPIMAVLIMSLSLFVFFCFFFGVGGWGGSGIKAEGHLLTLQLFAWSDVITDSYKLLTKSPRQPRMTLT